MLQLLPPHQQSFAHSSDLLCHVCLAGVNREDKPRRSRSRSLGKSQTFRRGLNSFFESYFYQLQVHSGQDSSHQLPQPALQKHLSLLCLKWTGRGRRDVLDGDGGGNKQPS